MWSPWKDDKGELIPRVLNGMLSIGPQASLRLEPGLVIKFSDSAGLDVNGSLIAEEAVLTSLHDDEYGGDADGSLSGEKSWQGVTLRGRNLVRLDETLIRYAKIGVTLVDAAPKLADVRIEDCWDAALGMDSLSTPQISALKLENNFLNGVVILDENLPEGKIQWSMIGDPGNQLVRVVRSPLTIGPTSQLVIDSGIIVKFSQGAELVIEGQVIAGSASGDPVYLTALSDDNHGGDTDNINREPMRGEWLGLRLNPNNTSVSVSLFDVSILYAATGLQFINPVELQVDALIIAESQSYGMVCTVPLGLLIEEMNIKFNNNGQDTSGCSELPLITP